jgi:hypothetical protein
MGRRKKMRIVEISTSGISQVAAYRTKSRSGDDFFSILHGEDGRGRWQVRIPLAARDFPSPAEHGEKLELVNEYKLVDLHKQDARGNELYLLALGQADGKQLILWSLSPGFRGGASYDVSGQARVIIIGEEAQGDAGRMGGASCPIVLVEGSCTLSWSRSGRLYGSDADWVAHFDEKKWIVAPVREIMNKIFLSAQEAQTMYGISTTALWKAVVEKKISKYKKKGKAFFLKTEVDELWGQPHLISEKKEQ